jgi:hypothetical protein
VWFGLGWGLVLNTLCVLCGSAIVVLLWVLISTHEALMQNDQLEHNAVGGLP